MHGANVKRLQDWIALPSIAAENRNFPEGAQYMARLAQDGGFTGVKLVPTAGKPEVFGKIDGGAKTTLGVYFSLTFSRSTQVAQGERTPKHNLPKPQEYQPASSPRRKGASVARLADKA